MEKIKINTNISKQSFYGFRKAFIQNTEITLEAKFLLILLKSHLGKNPTCWPSLSTLGRKMGRSRDSVRKYLKELQTKGYLNTFSRGIGRSHAYAPSYFKISAGDSLKTNQFIEPAEKTRPQPDESFRDRSIVSGNKDNSLKTGKELFDETRKRLGFTKGASIK